MTVTVPPDDANEFADRLNKEALVPDRASVTFSGIFVPDMAMVFA